MDVIPTVDYSPLSLSIDGEKLNEYDLKSFGEHLVNAFTTFGVVRLSNTGINEELVGSSSSSSSSDP